MVVTNEMQIPEDSELTVPEVNVTYPVLFAASNFIGKGCEWENNEFYLCRKETKDPRDCLQEGKDVTACALKVLQGIKKHCREQFDKHKDCLLATPHMEFQRCRESQADLDKCVLENLNIERPSFGYFCEAKIHETKRPPPTYDRDYPGASMTYTRKEKYLPTKAFCGPTTG